LFRYRQDLDLLVIYLFCRHPPQGANQTRHTGVPRADERYHGPPPIGTVPTHPIRIEHSVGTRPGMNAAGPTLQTNTSLRPPMFHPPFTRPSK